MCLCAHTWASPTSWTDGYGPTETETISSNFASLNISIRRSRCFLSAAHLRTTPSSYYFHLPRTTHHHQWFSIIRFLQRTRVPLQKKTTKGRGQKVETTEKSTAKENVQGNALGWDSWEGEPMELKVEDGRRKVKLRAKLILREFRKMTYWRSYKKNHYCWQFRKNHYYFKASNGSGWNFCESRKRKTTDDCVFIPQEWKTVF